MRAMTRETAALIVKLHKPGENAMTLLFCNVGWMERYEGQTDEDRVKGGGSWVKKNGTGHESCNFLPHRGSVYGFVQAQGEGIDLVRLGAGEDDEALDDLTVVWTAKRPNASTVIVGWYRHARAFDQYQKFRPAPTVQAANGVDAYLFTAAAKNATLLPLDARTMSVPRRTKGGMGQSNVWYIDKPEMDAYRREVETLIRVGRPPALPQAKKKRSAPDHARQVLVEKTAVQMCWTHYERLGYEVHSVEKDNVGWDLEAINGKARLCIEVKGLSGKAKQIELTPNEYVAFTSKDEDYRLAVVSDALAKPILSVARYSPEFNRYIVVDQDTGTLDIEPKTGAVVRFI